jgi:hypothetical protein
MTYETFLKLLLNYRKFEKNLEGLKEIGFDLSQGKYAIDAPVWQILKASLLSHYTEEGVDWISWFAFEAEWGEKDWSTNDCYETDENGDMELVHEAGVVRHGAIDKDGNPIAYSFESLYELLEKDYKL